MGKKFVVFCILATVGIFGGAFLLMRGPQATEANSASFTNEAKLEVSQKDFDWGNIPFKGGNIKADFVIKNMSEVPLRLKNVRTSCHCTQARVILENGSSPYFGMNTVSGWVGEVAPGGQAQVEVVFDPAYHGPGGVGPINRFVELETSDKNNKKLEFSVKGVVVK